VPLCADGTEARKPPHRGKKHGGDHDQGGLEKRHGDKDKEPNDFQPCEDGSKPTCNGKPLERGVRCEVVPLCADGTEARKPPHRGKKHGGVHGHDSFGKDLKVGENDEQRHREKDKDHQGSRKHGGDKDKNEHTGDRNGPKRPDDKPDNVPGHEVSEPSEGLQRMDLQQQHGYGTLATHKINQNGYPSQHNYGSDDAQKQDGPADGQGKGRDGEAMPGGGSSILFAGLAAAIGGIVVGIAGTLLWNRRRNNVPAARRASAVMVVDASNASGTLPTLPSKDVQTLKDVQKAWGYAENV